MGNSLGGKRTTKIMKINGETMKLKTPVQAGEINKDYPGYVLLESESVKHFGIRAKPLGSHQELKPRRLYFLVELPKFPEEKGPRKVRSGINMGAKDRLESLMLARRSASELTLLKRKSDITVEETKAGSEIDSARLKMRLPKAEVQKLMKECKNEAEAAEKLMQLCLGSGEPKKDPDQGLGVNRQVHTKEGGHGTVSGGLRAREKRVNFLPVKDVGIQTPVA